MEVRKDLLYSKTHEWVKRETEKIIVIGISDYAQKELTDIVYVELPTINKKYDKDSVIATVESVKASSSIYSPLEGTVIEVNSNLEKQPEKINASPYDEGWLAKIELTENGIAQINTLMNADDYEATITKKN